MDYHSWKFWLFDTRDGLEAVSSGATVNSINLRVESRVNNDETALLRFDL